MKPLRLSFLLLVLSLSNLSAQTILWDGGGDGVSWQDPLNWSGDKLPGATNTAVLNVPSNTLIVSRSNVTVRAVQHTGGLLLTNSSFTVTNGASFVNGLLVVGRDCNLIVQRSNTTFTANGPVDLTLGNVFAQSSGQAEFPALFSHADGNINFASRFWQAEGPGSRIVFASLTNLTGASAGALRIRTYSGGRIEFPALVTTPPGYLQLFAQDPGSRIDLPLLQTSPRRDSELEARAGGTIHLPNLRELLDMSLTIRDTNSFLPTAQLQTFSNATFVAVNHTPQLAALTNAAISSFQAYDGALIHLPGLTAYTNPIPQFSSRYFYANGAGSRVTLSNLVTFRGTVGGEGAIRIQTFNGGSVELPAVTSVPTGYIQALTDGLNSRIDLPALSVAPGGDSEFEVRNGATLHVPLFTELRDMTVVLRGTNSTLATAQWTTLSNVYFAADNAFPPLNNLTRIPLSSFEAANGARIELPQVTTYTNSVPQFQNRYLIARGAGSRVTLPALTNFRGTFSGEGAMRLQTYSGGRVELPAITTMPTSYLQLYAEGSNSWIDLPQLITSPGLGSELEVRSGGTLYLPLITTLLEANLTIRGTNSFVPTAQFTTLSNLTLTADNAQPDLHNVTAAPLCSFYAANGARLLLPGVRDYTTPMPAFTSRTWQADGAGSLIDLSALTNLLGAVNSFSSLRIYAYNGGTILLSNITTLPASYFEFYAQGAGANIQLPNLLNMPGAGSLFEARNSAVLNLPNLIYATNTTLSLRSGGSIQTDQIVSLDNSEVTVDGVTPNFSNVVSAAYATFYADNGGVLRLPNVHSYPGGIPAFQSRTWQARGAGSLLDLSSFTDVTGATNSFSSLRILAYTGGEVRLTGMNTVAPSHFEMAAEGSGALINLPNLSRSPRGGSVLDVRSGGEIRVPSLLHADELQLSIRNTGILPTAQILTLTNGSITAEASSPAFTGLTNISYSALNATAGGTLNLPEIREYEGPPPAFNGKAWLASGARSQLLLTNLAEIANFAAAFTELSIRAEAGGTNRLDRLQRIRNSHVRLVASSANSLLHAPLLAQFASPCPNCGGIEAQSSGRIQLPAGPVVTSNIWTTLRSDATIALGQLELQTGSRLNGSGALAGDLINGGEVVPGFSAGSIAVNNYVQTPSGTLIAEIGGSTPGSQFDVLTVSGSAQLDGSLSVVRLNNFSPALGSSYRLVSSSARVGEFSNYSGLNFGASTEFVPGFDNNGALVTAAFSTGPVLTNVSPSGIVSGSLTRFDLAFNEAINFGSISAADATLTSPTGLVTISSVSFINSRTARLNFPAQTTPGSYTVIIGPNIADVAGNLMNQDGDGVNGEATDRFTNVVNLSIGDLKVQSIVVTLPTVSAPGTLGSAVYVITNAGADVISGGRTDSILLSPNAQSSNATLLTLLEETATLPPGATLTRTQQFTIPAMGLAGSVFVGLQTDSGNAVPESVETNNVLFAAASVTVPLTLQLQLSTNATTETGAPINALVTRNGSLAASLLVTLGTDDASEVSTPPSVTIPAGQNSAPFLVSPVHDHLADGPQVAQVIASAASFTPGSNSLSVLDVDTPRLFLSAPASQVLEGSALTVTVTRDLVTTQELSVTLASSVGSQLSAPFNVLIAAGAASTNFTVSGVEDTLVESPRFVSLTASASNHVATNLTFTLLDNDIPALALGFSAASVSEGGQVTATLTRSPAGAAALVVELQSSLPGRAHVPSSVTLPPGQSIVTFPVSAVENTQLEGDQVVSMSAFITETLTGARLLPGLSSNLTVLDNDGPTLSVVLTRDAAREGTNLTATVTRNSPATNDLPVTLLSSDVAEASVPASVTISNGQSSANFTVTTLDDGVSDGSKPVTIYASAAGFTGGADTFLVTDVNLPDLVITSLSAPTNGLTGDNFNITFREMNLGTVNATGTWSQAVFLSSDPFPGDDEPLTEFTFSGTIPPGLFIERSTQLRAPLTPGDYWVIVKSDVSNRVSELVEDNNTAVAALPLRIEPSFTATVQTAVETALAGTPVPLTGSASRVLGGPAQFELVSIQVNVKGTRRVIAALTDASGQFSATFTPLPGEAGSYTIGAAQPGVSNAPIQDAFTLLGMRFDPASLAPQVPALSSLTNVINLINLADVPLSGLSTTLLNLHPAVQVTANLGSALPASGMIPVELTITSLVDAPLTNIFTLRVSTAEGAVADLKVTNRVTQLLPRLVAAPASLEAGMRRGGQTLVPFTVMNLGGAESGPITVLLPNQNFLHLSSPATLPSIPPGGSNTVTLQLLPATNQPLGVYSGTIALNATNSGLLVPYQFRALSEAVGNLVLSTVDEYTYYAAGAPMLAGADVIVRDSISGITITNGLTGLTGVFAVSNLIEGYYDLEVRAPQHSTYRSTILLPSGGTTNLTAFLSRQPVRYLWSVVPTEVEDRTRITIETVFETFVPIPVVTVEPALIDLADFTNEVTQIDLKIENHGLIAANNMAIHFGTHPDWVFTPLIEQVGTLNARSSITVPLTIRRVSASGLAAQSKSRTKSGACGVSASVNWTLICGGANNGYGAGITILNAGGGGCGGGGWIPVGGGAGSGYFQPIAGASELDCQPCEGDITQAVLECLIGFTPLGLPYDLGKNGYECYQGISANGWGGVGPCLGAYATTAAEEIIGLTPLGLPYDILKCAKDILEAACGGSGGGSSGSGGGGGNLLAPAKTATSGGFQPTYNLTPLTVQTRRLEDYLEPTVYVFGSTNWLSMNPGDGNVMSNLFAHFASSIATNGDAGMRFSSAEQSAFFALPRPAHIGSNEVSRLIERWNRTLDYADQGIYASTNVPFGMNPDFIAADLMYQKLLAANAVAIANTAEGYPTATDGVQSALNDLASQISSGSGSLAARPKAKTKATARAKSGGVCAQVKLRLEQDAVITRDGFRATLELINGADSPLENVSVQLVVQRGDTSDATGLFGISAPVLSGLANISGTGLVIPGTTGSASWTIIPTSDAAPGDEPLVYFVSGTLRYRQDGVDLTVPLSPSAINVYPNASLVLRYFHERDVLSDDPFTDAVEPSQPYSLAVMVQNTGHGTARNMRITSSQPKIIENEKGLLIDFDLIATEVAGENILPSLTVNFGDVTPGEISIGRWLLKSTLQGQFIDYSATFQHEDGLGDPRLSLIQSVEIHEMIRTVRATNSLNDSRPDFLVNDFADDRFLPDTLYFSDATTAPVTPVTSFVSAQTPSATNLVVQLQAALPSGWSYLRVTDPANGRFLLKRITRSDGAELPVENFWISDRTFIAGGRRPLYETNLHLLDFNSTGNYLLTYEPRPAPDSTAPSSTVAGLPAESYAGIPLLWSGLDNQNGSGLATFDVYVSDNGGAYALWLAGTTLRGSIFPGENGHTYAFYTRATDAAGNTESAPAVPDATTTVSLLNSAPVLTVGADQVVNEGVAVTILNTATDADPGSVLTFSLGTGSASGATINPNNGTVSWPTGEGTGPSTNRIVVVVTDNGTPQLSSSGEVTVVVNEVNQPPVLNAVTNRIVNELSPLTIQPFATDADVPANTLSFSLARAPLGLQVDSSLGTITWTPNAFQGPSTNLVSLVVSDNGSPSLSSTQSFSIIVRNTEGDFTLSLGSTNVLAGETNQVPLVLNSTSDITNVTVFLNVPPDRLTNLVLAPTAPELASSLLSPNGPGRSELRFTTSPGQVLDRAQTLASLGFTAGPETNSSIAPLTLSSLTATRSTGAALTNGQAYHGQVIIVGPQPVLTAGPGDSLTLYGHAGRSYRVQTATNLPGGLLWQNALSATLSNRFQRFSPGASNGPALFFRAQQN